MNYDKADSVISDLEHTSEQLKSIASVYQEVKELQSRMADSISQLDTNNASLQDLKEQLISASSRNSEIFESLQGFLKTKTQEIYDDNKAFQRELDASLSTRLTKQESDIILQIRNTGSDTQESVRQLLEASQKLIEAKLENYQQTMEVRLRDNFETQGKQLTILKIASISCIILSLGILIKLLA